MLSKIIVTLFSLMVLLSVNAAETWTNSHSEYTLINTCKKTTTDNDLPIRACPEKTPYRLMIGGVDSIDVLLKYQDLEFTHGYGLPRHIGKTLEWRYHTINGQKRYHALIYRLFTVGEKSKDSFDRYVQQLIVFRLDKANSCVLGSITQSKNMNTAARHLADNKEAKCLTKD